MSKKNVQSAQILEKNQTDEVKYDEWHHNHANWEGKGLDTLQHTNVLGSFVYVFWAIVLGMLIGVIVFCLRYLVHEAEYSNYIAGHSVGRDIGFPGFLGIHILLSNISVCLFVGYVTHNFINECVGSGILTINISIATGTVIPIQVGIYRFFLTALFIAGLTPVGMEGPVLHIASAAGSFVFQIANWSRLPVFLRIHRDSNPTFMVMGCTAGLSAAFNTPLAGILFALEEFMNHRHFGRAPILLALCGVASTCIFRLLDSAAMGSSNSSTWHFRFIGNLTSYNRTMDDTDLHYVYLLSIPIGIVSGVIAWIFTFSILRIRAWFYRATPYLRPQYRLVVAGCFSGLSSMTAYYLLRINSCPAKYTGWTATSAGVGNQVLQNQMDSSIFFSRTLKSGYDHCSAPDYVFPFGSGYQGTTANDRISSDSPFRDWQLWEIFVLFLAKLIGVCFITAAGGTGGIFSPALFLGGQIGLFFNVAIQDAVQIGTRTAILLPISICLGMAGTFAAILRLPLTSVVIVFEMAALGSPHSSYVLPLIITAYIGHLVASYANSEGMYDLMMRQDGLDPHKILNQRFVMERIDSFGADDDMIPKTSKEKRSQYLRKLAGNVKAFTLSKTIINDLRSREEEM